MNPIRSAAQAAGPATPSEAFLQSPSSFAAPGAIASLLGHGLPGPVVERMLVVPALRERVNRALIARLGDYGDELTSAQSAIATLDATALTRFALRAGAAWHARRIAKVYDGSTVRALTERIGAEFRASALADLAAAPPAEQDGQPEVALPELPTAIARDGAACVVAWCEAQPRQIGHRVLLRMRVNARPTPRHAEHGPPLIERLLSDQVT